MKRGSMERDFRITGWELASWIVCIVVFSLWNWITTRALSLEVPVFFAVMSFFCWLSGRLIADSFAEVLRGIADFNLFFLTGFFFINTAVYLLYLILPFTASTDFILVCFAVTVAAVIKYKTFRVRILKFTDSQDNLPSFLALLLILVATSLWTQSYLNPIVERGDVTIYKPYLDSFNHARTIAAIASSHGLRTLNHPFLSGEAAPFYHYAHFIIPAGLCAWTPTTAYQSFCGFLAPLGLLLSGLSAFVLIRSFWGPWAGFSACVALLLIPDPSQMGIDNHFLSYHWLQQVGPGLLYGVALMAIAWLFMFEGCKRGSFFWISISYAIFLVVANYKAHIVLANVFPMGVYPAIFFNKYSKSIRCIWFFAFLGLLMFMMKISELITIAPMMKLDGSALRHYTASIVATFDNNVLKAFFASKVATPFLMLNQCLTVALMGGMLFLGTFGAMGLLYFAMLWLFRKKMSNGVLLFPAIVIVNYLLMSLGLAYDSHGIGSPEEFLHRPFVWAYFVVTAWVGGMIYLRYRNILNRSGEAREVILAAVFLSLLFPLFLGREVQQGPSWGKACVNQAVPTGLVKACDFIRTHSERSDIVQDSQNDNNAFVTVFYRTIVTALSERQGYVIDSFWPLRGKLLAEQKGRLNEMAFVKKTTDPEAVVDFFVKRHIKWYLSHPYDDIAWDKDLLGRCVYESHGYRVYFFKDSAKELIQRSEI